MQAQPDRERPKLERLVTHVQGLDTVLQGGLLQGSVYVVQGDPGAGKTVLANQIAFNHARDGGKTVYVTLLAESHGRLLCYLEDMSFFDPALVPAGVYYVSAFGVLEQDGLKGLLDLLRREVRSHGASLLVLDGLTAVRDAGPGREVRRLVHELQAHASLSACTTLLLSAGFLDSPAEHTVVDGLIDLHDCPQGARDVRVLRVKKFRGSAYLRGRHQFRITAEGVTVFPRLEALLRVPSIDDVRCGPERLSIGAPALDELLGGGLPCGSTTVLLGPPGTGKTTLCVQFLTAVTRDAPGVMFSYYERPELLLEKADALGLPLRGLVREGALRLLWTPPTETLMDEIAHRVHAAVVETNARRLVLDGLDGFRIGGDDERLPRLFTALANELRVRGVTSLYTSEIAELFNPEPRAPITGISAVFENLLVMRQLELDFELRRVLSVAKLRDSEHSDGTREFCIMPGRGVVVSSEPFDPGRPMPEREEAARRSREDKKDRKKKKNAGRTP